METKVLDKKHIIIIGVAILSIIVSYFNATYAYFGTSKNEEISIRSVASFGEATVYNYNDILEGNLIYTSNKSEMLKKTTTSFKKDNVETSDYLLTVAAQVKPHDTLYELDEYTSISYEIYHKTDLSLDTSNFTCTDNNTYNNGTSDDYCNTGTFIENSLEGKPFELIKDFRISDTEMHYFDVYIYLNSNIESKAFKVNIFFLDKETEKVKKEKTLEEVKTFISNNEPDLNTGLIPVVYDGDNKTENGTGWFVADTSKAWYDYESQLWANAVSVDSSTTEKRQKYVNTDGTYKSGTKIAEEDMLAMFVWIPRFSYTIGCTSSTECYGYKIEKASNVAQATPGAIDIKFVSKDAEIETYTGDSPTYTYTKDATTGLPTADRTPNNWYTHPAFWWDDSGKYTCTEDENGETQCVDKNEQPVVCENGICPNDGVRAADGSEELSGIWVGKFETSVNPSSTCYTTNLIPMITTNASTNCVASKVDVTPRILPNVLSLVFQNVYNEYMTAKKFTSTDEELKCGDVLCNVYYGLTTNTDSHMMKNSEWGAVAYLSQSIYGKYGNANYEGANKEIYKNDSGESSWARYTGRSEGIYPSSTSSYSIEGTYKYNDIKIIQDEEGNYIEGKKEDYKGTGASTTGNIYGIYDMSGGAYEYVMGYYTEASSVFGGKTSSSGTELNSSGFTNETKPDSKYFDGYKGTISGDTKSIDLFTKSNEVIGHATAETNWWYSDTSSSISASYPWVRRGDNFNRSSSAGVFYSNNYNGNADYFSFRSILATIVR